MIWPETSGAWMTLALAALLVFWLGWASCQVTARVRRKRQYGQLQAQLVKMASGIPRPAPVTPPLTYQSMVDQINSLRVRVNPLAPPGSVIVVNSMDDLKSISGEDQDPRPCTGEPT